MSRRRLLLVALPAGAVFLALALALARFLTVENRERDAVHALLAAQAAGDGPRLAAQLQGCAQRPACARQARALATRLRRPGDVKILRLDSATAYSLGDAEGDTRVVWSVVERGLPVVQCVAVRRSGNALTGHSITLLRLSAPIPREGSC